MCCTSAGAFVGPDGKTLPIPEDLPNAHMRLFGGAQYHRAMAEFRIGALLRFPFTQLNSWLSKMQSTSEAQSSLTLFATLKRCSEGLHPSGFEKTGHEQ